MKTFIRIYVIALAGLFGSCTKDKTPKPVDPPGDTTIKVTKLELNKAGALLLPDSSIQLFFDITPANASNKRVVWTSSNVNIATVDTNGLVRAISNGSVNIIAGSRENISLTDTTKLIVLKDYEVHAVGQGNTPQYDKQAIYWINEQPSTLPGGYAGGFDANAIRLTGTDVYIGGTTGQEYGWQVPTFWKNNVPKQMIDTLINYQNYVTGLEVNGDDVYLSSWGFDMINCPNCQYVYYGHYWKTSGGIVTDTKLYDDSSSTGVNAILLKDSRVYAAGWQANDNFFRRAKFWTNNFSTGSEFTSGSFAEVKAMAVKGNEFYFAGYDHCGSTTCIETAKLWRSSGASIQITDGSHHAKINAIGFIGDDIILAGYEKNSADKYVAKYWRVRNNVVTAYQVGTGNTDSQINGLAIVGEEIFLAGFEVDGEFGNKQARYWRAIEELSMPFTLYSSTPYNAKGEIKAIAVK